MANLYWPEGPFLLRRRRRERGRRRSWQAAEQAARSLLLVTHGGCLDGAGCAIVALRRLGRDHVGVCTAQPGDLAELLGWLSRHPGRGRTLLVADLSLQPEQLEAVTAACAALRRQGWGIEWRDHHHKQWEGIDLAPLRKQLDVLEVNDDASESGASLVQRALAPNDRFLARLAETVRDRDLWWNRLPASEQLEFALTDLGWEGFVDHMAALPAKGPVLTAGLRDAAARERRRQDADGKALLGQARFWGEAPRRVGVVYGWLPKNTGLHQLIEDGCAVAINVRPNGKMSLRSRKDAPVCQRIARGFGGGGHPNASGGTLGLRGVRYWAYVVRRGNVAAVERLAMRSLQELEAEGAGAA